MTELFIGLSYSDHMHSENMKARHWKCHKDHWWLEMIPAGACGCLYYSSMKRYKLTFYGQEYLQERGQEAVWEFVLVEGSNAPVPFSSETQNFKLHTWKSAKERNFEVSLPISKLCIWFCRDAGMWFHTNMAAPSEHVHNNDKHSLLS